MKEKTLKSQILYEGKILNVYKDKVELENGKEDIREYVHNDGGVCVLALTENQEIIFVKQFRYPFKEVLYEIPGGRKEKEESFIQTGSRELKEETGYVSQDVNYFGYLYPTVAYCSEVIHMVLAKNCHYEKQCLDEGEFVEVVLIPVSKVKEMILKNEIKDAKTLVALLKYFSFYEN